jgi:hypothetical protein
VHFHPRGLNSALVFREVWSSRFSKSWRSTESVVLGLDSRSSDAGTCHSLQSRRLWLRSGLLSRTCDNRSLFAAIFGYILLSSTLQHLASVLYAITARSSPIGTIERKSTRWCPLGQSFRDLLFPGWFRRLSPQIEPQFLRFVSTPAIVSNLSFYNFMAHHGSKPSASSADRYLFCFVRSEQSGPLFLVKLLEVGQRLWEYSHMSRHPTLVTIECDARGKDAPERRSSPLFWNTWACVLAIWVTIGYSRRANTLKLAIMNSMGLFLPFRTGPN